MTDYGTDISCSADIDQAFRLVSGTERVTQALYRRLTTKRGSVADAPDYGFDVRELLSRGLTDDDVGSLAGIIRQEILKEECVSVAVVATTLVDGALQIDARCESSVGPLAFVLSVTEAAVVLLKEAA